MFFFSNKSVKMFSCCDFKEVLKVFGTYDLSGCCFLSVLLRGCSSQRIGRLMTQCEAAALIGSTGVVPTRHFCLRPLLECSQTFFRREMDCQPDYLFDSIASWFCALSVIIEDCIIFCTVVKTQRDNSVFFISQCC